MIALITLLEAVAATTYMGIEVIVVTIYYSRSSEINDQLLTNYSSSYITQ